MKDVVVIEEKSYISSSRVAEISSYKQDYIGQLVRQKKISGQKIGRSWYVEEVSLWKHWAKINGFTEQKTVVSVTFPVKSAVRKDSAVSPVKEVPVEKFKLSNFLTQESFLERACALAMSVLIVSTGIVFAGEVSPQDAVSTVRSASMVSLEISQDAGKNVAVIISNAKKSIQESLQKESALTIASGQNPFSIAIRSTAIGVYKTFNPIFKNIENGIFRLGHLAVGTLTVTTEYANTVDVQTINAASVDASTLFVGSTTTPQTNGITIFDRVMGQPYCIFLLSGTIQNTAGACGTFDTPSTASSTIESGVATTTNLRTGMTTKEQ